MKMSFRTAIGLALTIWLAMPSAVSAQVNKKKGAVLGGLSGAAIGAIIGDHNHEAGAGAAIGGAIGAVAGGVLGNSANQYDHGYRYQQLPQPVAAPRAIAIGDVVAMAQNRVSDPVIISAIQANGIQRPLDVPDIVYLSQQGVSDGVIRAMQNAGNAPVVVARPVPPPRTVVIDRYPFPGPVYYPYRYPRRPPPPHYHHTGRRPTSGVNISFGTQF